MKAMRTLCTHSPTEVKKKRYSSRKGLKTFTYKLGFQSWFCFVWHCRPLQLDTTSFPAILQSHSTHIASMINETVTFLALLGLSVVASSSATDHNKPPRLRQNHAEGINLHSREFNTNRNRCGSWSMTGSVSSSIGEGRRNEFCSSRGTGNAHGRQRRIGEDDNIPPLPFARSSNELKESASLDSVLDESASSVTSSDLCLRLKLDRHGATSISPIQ